MMIQLKAPALVRVINTGNFVTLPEGSHVNYSSKRNGGSMVHTIASMTSRHGMVEQTEVTPWQEQPSWLASGHTW